MSQARNKYSVPIAPKQVQLIHIAKADLGLDEGVYRDLLAGFGAESCKELTAAQADQLLDDLKAKGFRIVSKHPRPAKRRKGPNVVHLASLAEIDKVNAVAGLIAWKAKDGLALFLEKRLRLKDGRVRTAGEAYRAIEALKKMFEHQMLERHGATWWTTQLDDPDVRRYIRRHCPAEYADAVTWRLKQMGVY